MTDHDDIHLFQACAGVRLFDNRHLHVPIAAESFQSPSVFLVLVTPGTFGDTGEFASLMHQHWLHKKARSGGISNSEINRWYDVGVANGAVGGKLIGAGGGGFLMFYANDKEQLKEAMAKEGLHEVRFSFDYEGTKVVIQDF